MAEKMKKMKEKTGAGSLHCSDLWTHSTLSVLAMYGNLQICKFYITLSVLCNIFSCSLLRLIQLIQIHVFKLCTHSNSNGLIFNVRLINVFTYALS